MNAFSLLLTNLQAAIAVVSARERHLTLLLVAVREAGAVRGAVGAFAVRGGVRGIYCGGSAGRADFAPAVSDAGGWGEAVGAWAQAAGGLAGAAAATAAGGAWRVGVGAGRSAGVGLRELGRVATYLLRYRNY